MEKQTPQHFETMANVRAFDRDQLTSPRELQIRLLRRIGVSGAVARCIAELRWAHPEWEARP